jgi:hypothetical protein
MDNVGKITGEGELAKIKGADILLKTLDMLAALVPEDRIWTAEERNAYESSVRILKACDEVGRK